MKADPGALPCKPHITEAALPHRSAALLRREQSLYPQQVGRMLGRGRSHAEGAEAFTFGQWSEVVQAKAPTTLSSALWVAGRCATGDAAADAQLTEQVRAVVAGIDATNPRALGRALIEGAMALGLRGDVAGARALLVPLASLDGPTGDDAWLAAFYLAQLGEPAGYPALHASLRAEDGHTRLMAVRHVLAFQPWEGQEVGGVKVEVVGELVKRLKDHDADIRAEVPWYLREADAPELKKLLAPVARGDRSKEVREAAAEILKGLEE